MLIREAKSVVVGGWVPKFKLNLGYAASHVSPLVLDLDGDGIELSPYTKGVYFDIDNDGFVEKVSNFLKLILTQFFAILINLNTAKTTA